MDGFVMAEKSNTNEDAAQTALMCQFCDQQNIKWKCVDCDILLCSSCKEKIHKKLKSADKHKILSIQDIGKNSSTAKKVNSNIVTVTITHLVLSTGAAVLDTESIFQLFVSYNFLGIKAHELETPFSLPKPKAEQPINFNFSKTFHVDMATNYPKRKYLAGMLLPDDPDGGSMGKKYCCVPLCHNTSDTVTENGSKVILHRFPMSEKKSHIKRQWITRVNNVRANFVVNDSSRICSEHFEGPFTDQSLPTRFPSKPQKEVKTRRPLLKYELNVDNNNNIPPCDTNEPY
ncbi:RPGRIP1L [Mytilus edulis]|uniref:RPGRIP1L n=1 Tax=Mytilus edulis TaxID=6550 RepID=A0A8S3QPA2_MYTED|nr:RPGRIP1L [Mytilus edulis]